MVEQLLLRTRAMMRDLPAKNGLYPAGSASQSEQPAQLWDARVADIEARTGPLLHAAATAVAALRHSPAMG